MKSVTMTAEDLKKIADMTAEDLKKIADMTGPPDLLDISAEARDKIARQLQTVSVLRTTKAQLEAKKADIQASIKDAQAKLDKALDEIDRLRHGGEVQINLFAQA